MANEFRYGIDQNGVRHPVCDDTRVDWSSYARTGSVNGCDTSNAVNATNLVSAVGADGIVTFKDETTAKWSNSYIAKAHIESGKTYYFMTNTKNPLVYGRIAINKSATSDPSVSDTADVTVLNGGTKLLLLTPTVGVASFVANETADVYFWYCNDREMSTQHAVFSAGFILATSKNAVYAPYTMDNKELTKNKLSKFATLLTSADDLDNIVVSNGEVKYFYWLDSRPAHSPNNSGWCFMECVPRGSTQQIIHQGAGTVYIRENTTQTHGTFYQFNGTAVS